MPAPVFSSSQSCAPTGGIITISSASVVFPGGEPVVYNVSILGTVDGRQYGDELVAPQDFAGLPNQSYRVQVSASDGVYSGQSAERLLTISCGPGSGGGDPALMLNFADATPETAAGGDGTATIQASGGTAPLTASLVELSLSEPATSGQPTEFDGLPSSLYTLRVTDSSSPVQTVEAQVTVGPYVAPVTGCLDEYATDYDPAATTAGTCTYAPLWRSAWGPAGMAVAVPTLPGQEKAYTVALLRIGFRPGHPLAAIRPLGEPLKLRATVGPQGFAVFRLGPYLRPQLGAADEAGGYRLDLNSPTAATDDLFVGYELRRTTGELLEHGYAVNAAVPDAQLATGAVLSPFAKAPVWPGYDFLASCLRTYTPLGQYGIVSAFSPLFGDFIQLPCPPNPLPVAWLTPQGGYGYWVFQGRPQLGDDVGEGQTFTEAATGESRYSQRGAARGTITASSGVFNGPQFGEGLRTLWASPQVWYQPVAGGEWVPVTLSGGSFPVRRLGLARTEVTLTFTEARPHYAQGQ